MQEKVRPVIDVSDGVSDSKPSQQISGIRLPAQLSLVFKMLMIIAIILLTSSSLIISELTSSEYTIPQFIDNQTSTHDVAWNRRSPDGNEIQISDAAIKNSLITEASLQGYCEYKVIHKHSSWWGGCHKSD